MVGLFLALSSKMHVEVLRLYWMATREGGTTGKGVCLQDGGIEASSGWGACRFWYKTVSAVSAWSLTHHVWICAAQKHALHFTEVIVSCYDHPSAKTKLHPLRCSHCVIQRPTRTSVYGAWTCPTFPIKKVGLWLTLLKSWGRKRNTEEKSCYLFPRMLCQFLHQTILRKQLFLFLDHESVLAQ